MKVHLCVLGKTEERRKTGLSESVNSETRVTIHSVYSLYSVYLNSVVNLKVVLIPKFIISQKSYLARKLKRGASVHH